MTDERRRLGIAGEDATARWYHDRGYLIEARNWRCTGGEIDLVVTIGSTLVFCEVKTRSTSAFGTGAEAVTPAKQLRLRKLANAYLAQREGYAEEIRFDVASVAGLKVEVIEDAF